MRLLAFNGLLRLRSACRIRRTPSVAPPRFYCRAWGRCRHSRSVGISVTSANRRPMDAARNGQVRPGNLVALAVSALMVSGLRITTDAVVGR